MADNSVFITGAAEGAFVEAMEGLPPWATQKTAEDIESILRKSLGIQTKALSELVKCCGGKGQSPEEIKKTNDELGKLVKNLKKENDEYPKRRKFWRDENDANERKRRQWREDQKQSAHGFSISALLIKVGEGAKQAFEDNVNTFDQLYRAGINVVSGFEGAASGFEALQQMAALTGVRYTELAATMEKYSAAVNSFGAAKFAKAMTIASAELYKFGYSTKETGELLGAYLETQRGFNNVNSKTQEEVVKDLTKFGERITKVSTATGMMRSKILDNLDALSKSVEATILAGQIGADASQRTQEFVASFGRKDVGEAFLRMMTDAIKPLNTTFMDFQKIGFGGFGQKLMNFTQSLKGLDPEEAQRLTAEFVAANQAEMGQITQQANLLRQVGMREADGALTMIAGMEQSARAYKSMTAEERKKMEIASEASKALQSAWERFKAQFQITFAPFPEMLDTFTSMLKLINSAFDAVRGWVTSLEGFINSFNIVKENVGEIKLIPWVGIAAAAYAMWKSLTLLPAAIKMVGSGLLWLGRRAIGKAGGGSEGAGRGGAGSGGRSGRGGMLGGLASLSGFKLLAGAASLIGIAGALYIAGKAIKQFSEIEWKDIGKAAATLTGLAAAGLVLGKASPMMLLGAAGLGLMSGSLYLAGKSIKQFTEITWDDVGKAAATLTGLAVAGVALGKAGPMMILGAAGLGLISASLFIAGKGVKQFTEINWGDVGKAIATLTALGATAALLGLPPVAVPVAIGGALIAGLSLTLWGFGKAAASAAPGITALARSFGEFAKIDGKALLMTSGGIVALTGALSAFALAGVASGVGNVLGSITDGISKLFGGDSILNKLKEFASLGPGMHMAAYAFGIIGSNMSQLSTAIDKFTGLDKLKSIVSAINGLNVAKAKALGGIVDTKSVSLPSMKSPVGVSVPTSPKPSTLNSPSQVSTTDTGNAAQAEMKDKSVAAAGTGIEKTSPDNSINSMLGYQNSLLEQLVMSTNNLVSVNSDILKFTRVRA